MVSSPAVRRAARDIGSSHSSAADGCPVLCDKLQLQSKGFTAVVVDWRVLMNYAITQQSAGAPGLVVTYACS